MVYINRRKVLSFSCIGLLVILIFVGCHSRKEVSKISDLAYDENKESGYTVNIQENSKHVPYLVLTNNYNGNTLLLRKETLDEAKAYSDYISYYKDSIIDKYLNNEFYELLGNIEKQTISESDIIITKRDVIGIEEYNKCIEKIRRKIFLLSVTEIGYKDLSTAMKEGKPLKYFNNPENRIAYKNGKAISYWLRTRDTFSDSTFFAMTYNGKLGAANAYDESDLRPAFCVDNNLKVKKSEGIVEGKSVYTLDLE